MISPIVMERIPLASTQFAILLGIRFIDPISFSMLMPFVYFMVRDFHVTDDSNKVGLYAGFLASSFAIAEFMSSVVWGMISDRIGRKPVLMMGMAGTAVSILLFGVSQSLAWAIVSRFAAGLLSGNTSVLKSMMAEMTDSTNRALGFSYLSMAYGLGFIVGPVMGGFLTHPTDSFPSLFGGSTFLSNFPYFLPCAVTAVLCAIGMILCQIFMKETLKRSDKTLAQTVTTPEPDSVHVTKVTWIAIISYTSLSFFTVIMEELFSFWAATSPERGGLGFNAPRIGTIFAISGLVLVLMQLLVYPFIQRCLGTMFLYKWVFIIYTPIVIFIPYINNLPHAFIIVTIAYGFRTCCGVTAFTSYNILLPETCSSRILGKVNGISHSFGALTRAFGPSLCGFVWSWSLGNGLQFPFDYHFMFFLVAFLCLVTFFIVTRIKLPPP